MKKNYQLKVDSNNDGQTSLNELNQNIDFIYNIISKNFKESMLKTRFEFKKEILTTLIFNNSTHATKKIKIESYVVNNLLINLRRAISLKMQSNSGSINLLNNMDYKILNIDNDKEESEDLNDSEKSKGKGMSEKDNIKKITLFINTKFLQNYPGFIKRLIVKENSSSFMSDENELFRCSFCSSILPKIFIKMTDESKNSIIKSFYQKAQKCWEYTMVFRHPKFLKNIVYDDIGKIMDQLTNLSTISESKIADTSKRMKSFLENALQKVQNQNNIKEEFTKDVIKHVRMQIKHYNKTKKLDRIMNDIEDATREFNTKTDLLKNDLCESIDYLKNIQDFHFKNTDFSQQNETEKLKTELTIIKKSIDKLERKDLKFKQVR
jgi:hypothetical protein